MRRTTRSSGCIAPGPAAWVAALALSIIACPGATPPAPSPAPSTAVTAESLRECRSQRAHAHPGGERQQKGLQDQDGDIQRADLGSARHQRGEDRDRHGNRDDRQQRGRDDEAAPGPNPRRNAPAAHLIIDHLLI